MSNPRISVSQLKQLIQLRSNNLSTRDIARALSLSQGAVSKYCRAVLAACSTWEAALALDCSGATGEGAAARPTPPDIAASQTPTIIIPPHLWIVSATTPQPESSRSGLASGFKINLESKKTRVVCNCSFTHR